VVRGDFYNGINLSFLLDRRAADASPEMAGEDHARAQGVRRRLMEACNAKLEQASELSQGDRYWVLATLQQAAVGLGDEEAAQEWGRQALEQQPSSHMVESSQEQLDKLRSLLSRINAKLG
jgi:hypothetical protein